MGISIYYTAKRKHAMTESEQTAVIAIKAKYSVHELIEQYCRTRNGLNWEDFTLYDPTLTVGAIIEGATGLPDNSEDALWIGAQHWCKALSELRRLIPDAAWDVHVEDHDIHWDEDRLAYDPSK
ncbi:MAG TPA: hypothetical protein VIM11_04335 [Tepidisphaeraceae bacterium]